MTTPKEARLGKTLKFINTYQQEGEDIGALFSYDPPEFVSTAQWMNRCHAAILSILIKRGGCVIEPNNGTEEIARIIATYANRWKHALERIRELESALDDDNDSEGEEVLT